MKRFKTTTPSAILAFYSRSLFMIKYLLSRFKRLFLPCCIPPPAKTNFYDTARVVAHLVYICNKIVINLISSIKAGGRNTGDSRQALGRAMKVEKLYERTPCNGDWLPWLPNTVPSNLYFFRSLNSSGFAFINRFTEPRIK